LGTGQYDTAQSGDSDKDLDGHDRRSQGIGHEMKELEYDSAGESRRPSMELRTSSP